MSVIEILAVMGIIGYIIFRQVQGEPLRGKRTVLLPAILTVIGFLNLRGSGGTHLTSADIICLVIGTVGAVVIGLAFGTVIRLEARGGFLWARLPLRGLWLWAALVAWRVAVMVTASEMHAHVAASSATLLFGLGVNRLAQAAVIVMRAMAAGVPFAPEKDGKIFMADTFNRGVGGGRFGDRAVLGDDDGDRRGYGDRDFGDRAGTGDRGAQGTRGSQGGGSGQDSSDGRYGYGARGRRRGRHPRRRGRQ